MQPKLDAMERMLKEQQGEVSEGYRFAAACKLSSVIERKAATSIALVFGLWRRACVLVEASDAQQSMVATALQAAEAEATAARAAETALSETKAALLAARKQTEASVAAAKAEAEKRVAGASVHQPRLEMLERMVKEQQNELTEGYRFSASCKLGAALNRRSSLALLSGFDVWRRMVVVVTAEETQSMISAAADKRAAEHEKASSASAASTKELELLRANAKRFEGMLKEAERQLQAQVEKAQATAEAEKAQASSGFDAKVRVMEDIIHEQQSELSGTHRFAAACKLSGALEKRVTATLSSFFGAWHRYYLILAGTEQAKAFASATEAKGASEVAELRAELGGASLRR